MKFFHRFSTINYRFFGLVDNIILNCEKKTKYTKVIDYLRKYEYVLNRDTSSETSNKYPNKIWQCWFQGYDNMPDIVKSCTKSVKKYYGNDVIFLDNNNINDYIDLPDYIIEKHQKGIIPYANFSDILRLSLLSKYGGCWIDSTIYLTDKIPTDILASEFFTFRSYKSAVLNSVKNIEDYKLYCNNFNSIIAFESPYFLRATPNNKIINNVLNLFLEYWKHENKLVDYLMIDKFFVLTILHNPELKKEFLNMPAYYFENVLLLQHIQFEKFDKKIFDQIKSFSSVHKMTHKNINRNPYNDSFLKHIIKDEFIKI